MGQLLARYARGEVPLARVFFHDMLLVGTVVNIVTGALALAFYAGGFPAWLAVAIFLSPLPYNIALCVFVWRSAARNPSGWSDLARAGSALWLLAVMIV